MERKQNDFQNNFVKDSTKKLNKKYGLDIVLWSSCPSFVTIKLNFNDEKLVDFETIKKVVFNEINENENLKFMHEVGFYKSYDTVKKGEKEIHYVWHKKRTRDQPFGKVKIYMCDGWYYYGSDQGGSIWKKHNHEKWELVTFK